MLRILLFLTSTLMFQLTGLAAEINRYWYVTEVSSMMIDGATNMNAFQCGTERYSGSDNMIRERWDPASEKWEISGSVYIDIAQFDCQNRMMNNDFRQTLNYSMYPGIQIEFMNMKEIKSATKNRKVAGRVDISLAGESHSYYMISELEMIDRSYSILRGEQVLRFSDFGIEPPQKGFGLIRVDDIVKVRFEFILELTDFAKTIR